MNFSLRAALKRLGLTTLFLLLGTVAHADTFRPFNPSNPTDPYGLNLAGETVITSTGYDYHHWGVLLDEIVTQSLPLPSLTFTALSTVTGLFGIPGSFSLSETDMFMNRGNSVLDPFDSNLFSANFTAHQVTPSGVTLAPGLNIALIRKYHFSTQLYRDTLSTPNFDVGAPERLVTAANKKVIILIHGWNSGSSMDSYDETDNDKEFLALRRNIGNAIVSAPDWSLVLYRWAQDADTGPKAFELNGDLAIAGRRNGSEAAESGHRHGKNLGQLLADLGVEKVHFIAHSAGTWVARSAAERVLRMRPEANVAVTLLDPYIPGAMGTIEGPRTSGLTKSRIDDIKAFGSTGSVFRLENYYSIDFTDYVSSNATSQVFSWRSGDINGLQVGGFSGLGFDPYGDRQNLSEGWGHFGPIQYYADTVHATSAQVADLDVFNRLSLAGLVDDAALSAWGWRRSIFMNEPVFTGTGTIAVTAGQSAILAPTVNTRGAIGRGQSATGFYGHQWQKRGTSGVWSNIPEQAGRFVGTQTASLTIVGALASDQGSYRLSVSRDYLTEASPAIALTVSGGGTVLTTPTAPSNLVATAVSASRINLTWADNSNNESGFQLQRRLVSGATWTDLPSVGANVTAFANTSGLSAGTGYVYRVRATNSAGNSGWSSEAGATTFPAANSNVALTVYAVDTTTNPLVPLNVAINTWTGIGQDYQTLTTAGAVGFTRSFPINTTGWFSAPPTLPDGRTFRYWLFSDGVTSGQDFATVTSFNFAGPTQAFAHYAFGAAPAHTLSSLAIEGAASVNELSSTSYRAKATYTDGSTAYVNASWSDDSSYASISSGGVLDAGAVSSDQNVQVTATYSSGGVNRTATKSVTIRNTDVAATYTLTRNPSVGGTINAYPNQSSYSDGTVVRLYANAASGYRFVSWGGTASGTVAGIDVLMNGNLTVTATFALDTSVGSLRVDMVPPQAVAEGAQWQYRLGEWQGSGFTQGNIAVGSGYVDFKDIPGWIKPTGVGVSITGTQQTVASGTYREILGGVQVAIEPAQAAQAGARWRLDGGAWQESGVAVPEVSTGNHTIEFLAVAGWTTPPSQTVSVARGIISTKTGAYGPPAGLPIITSVSPRTGPISGGTTVTIDGANFLNGATVTFGGVAATSVTVVSATRITAVTPPRASYGTVALALTSGGQTVTQTNGFSYLNPIGSNIELVSQIGGNVAAVAVVGNTAYFGQGTSLVVADFTNSAAPVERGRIALPGFVNDIAVSGNIAYVADSFAGLYAVDVSSPTAPSIVGFYDTEGSGSSVVLNGTTAYVADGVGLQILDVTNPAAIVRSGFVATAGHPQRVAVGTIGAEKYAFVAEDNLALRVIRVTNPAAAVEIAAIPAQSGAGITDVKLVGTALYVSDWQYGVKIFNASNPAALVQIGSGDTNVNGGAFIDAVGNRLYACSVSLGVADLTVTPNASNLGYYSISPSCTKLVVSNNLAFVAMGSGGLKVVTVTNPASMSLRSSIQTLSNPQDVKVSGGVVFVGNDSGLHTVDVSNPAIPVRLATLAGSEVSNIVVTAGRATLVRYGDKTVRIASIANPSAPTLLGNYTNTEAWDVALMGTTPILAGATIDAAHHPKLDVLNLSNPSSPQSTGSLLLDSTSTAPASALAVVGSWAFFGRTPPMLDIVSLANPSSPQKVGSIAVPLYAGGGLGNVAANADGNYVYMGSTAGIQIVNVTVKNAPVLGAVIDPPETVGSYVQRLRVVGNRLFVYEQGFLSVFDITTPASPQLIGYYDTPGFTTGFDASGDFIYVADGNCGLAILRVKDVSKPTIAINSPTSNTAYSTTSPLLSLGGSATDDIGVVRVSWVNDRGGGGVATGTSAWTIANIQLTSGVNNITVTAEDANGNLATDTIAVTATVPDTTPPAVTITGPKPDATFTTEADAVTLSGSAVDNIAVTAVTWADDRGHTGNATVTGQNWSIAPLALDFGPTAFTVTAQDAAGNVGSDSVTILRNPPDATPPQVAISFPTLNESFWTEEATINVSGSASDAGTLARVEWSNDRGGSGIASGSTVWSANGIVLQTGANVITVTAFDAGGNIARDTLSVTYALPPTVTPGAGANGSISPNVAQTVSRGSSVAFTAAPLAGFVIDQWLVNGVAVQNGGSAFTLSDVAGDTTVQVTFAPVPPPIWVVTPAAGANGSVSPGTPQAVSSGGSMFLTAAPVTGYTVNQWLVNGIAVQTGGFSYTLGSVAGDTTVQATFRVQTFTVTPSAGANGSVSPNTVQTVNSGGSASFTGNPSAGYAVDQWVVNSAIAQTGGAGYTVSNVIGSTTVQATFKAMPQYTVTPSAGANGSISPNTVQAVNSGGSVTFNATPALGYRVNQWLVNGVAVQTGGVTYTGISEIVGPVTANTTVQVTFTVAVTRDFNNDGKADIMFQNTVGQIAAWYMNGSGALASSAYLYSAGLGDWRIMAVADVNQDGKADILFQNTIGQIAVWYMNGSGGVTITAYLYTGSMGDWRVKCAADFNGDGIADLIFQNNIGQIAVWYLNASGATTSAAYLSSAGLGDWRVVGIADINGDGKTDLLFQNTIGQVAVWYLNGSGVVTSSAYLSTSNLGDWRVAAVSDMNGDGIADLVFQNNIGQIAAWYLNASGGTTSTGYLYTGALGDWRVR